MKSWKKGVVIGAVWGLLNIIAIPLGLAEAWAGPSGGALTSMAVLILPTLIAILIFKIVSLIFPILFIVGGMTWFYGLTVIIGAMIGSGAGYYIERLIVKKVVSESTLRRVGALVILFFILLVFVKGYDSYQDRMNEQITIHFREVTYNGETYLSGERFQEGKSLGEHTIFLTETGIVNRNIVLVRIENVGFVDSESSKDLRKLEFYINPDDPNHIYSKLYRRKGKPAGGYQEWIKKSE